MSSADRAMFARDVLASPRLGAAATTTAVALSLFAQPIETVMGLGALISALVVLTLLMIGIVVARFREIEWSGLLPISLLLFLAWAGISVFTSQYQWATLGSLAYLVAFTTLGVTIALTRDPIQVLRAYGDALRGFLTLSFAIEVFSGVLIDTPLPFLGVQGNLDQFGPIQGLAGSRNQLALIAMIAMITFGIELLTKSVGRTLGVLSLVLGALCLVLSRSPIVYAVALVVGIAVAALALIRRAKPEQRTFWQLALVVVAVIGAVIAWLFRARIIEIFAANSDLTYRVRLWQRAWALIAQHPIEGWGWIGRWQTELQPFPLFASGDPRVPDSALNAYIDVWFQLGLVGVFLFVVLVGLTFTRSWLLAGRRRNVLNTWPALVMVALLVTSLGESALLFEFGWLTLVVCCVQASRELSWRRAFTRTTSE